MTLIFTASLYNASKFSYDDVKYLGMIQIGLGMMGALYTGYGLMSWALGFGMIHIRYERKNFQLTTYIRRLKAGQDWASCRLWMLTTSSTSVRLRSF